MAEDISLPGKLTDLSDPKQLHFLNKWIQQVMARLNQIDPGSVALAWLEGAAANQVILSQGIANSPVWTEDPTVASVTATDLTASQLVATDAGKKLVSVAPAGTWSVTAGYTEDRSFNPEATSDAEVARVLGTLIDTLKSKGLLG